MDLLALALTLTLKLLLVLPVIACTTARSGDVARAGKKYNSEEALR